MKMSSPLPSSAVVFHYFSSDDSTMKKYSFLFFHSMKQVDNFGLQNNYQVFSKHSRTFFLIICCALLLYERTRFASPNYSDLTSVAELQRWAILMSSILLRGNKIHLGRSDFLLTNQAQFVFLLLISPEKKIIKFSILRYLLLSFFLPSLPCHHDTSW